MANGFVRRVALLGLLTACQAQRELVVVSEPPGAEVRLDERAIGTTPLRVSYEHEGTRSLTLHRPGRATQFRLVELNGPWFAAFPLDLVTELGFGWAWKDVERIEVTLPREDERVTKADIDALLTRAESLRRAGPDGPRSRPDTATDEADDPSASEDKR